MQVSSLDSLKIMLTNAAQIAAGQERGLDGAPVAEVGTYQVGGWVGGGWA
jgi:hypothetical protein